MAQLAWNGYVYDGVADVRASTSVGRSLGTGHALGCPGEPDRDVKVHAIEGADPASAVATLPLDGSGESGTIWRGPGPEYVREREGHRHPFLRSRAAPRG